MVPSSPADELSLPTAVAPAQPLVLARAASPLARGGRAFLDWAQRFLYRRVMDVRLVGSQHVPKEGGFVVAANHASHLDAGLVKEALGRRGDQMRALAASDYFFSQPWKRWYFENFTNVMPLERNGNFRASLKRALGVLRHGSPLLVFPEGTRSRTGRMAPFKPAISSMALMAGRPILPVYLWGTYEAMPKGGGVVPKVRRIGATVGPALPAKFLANWTANLPRHEAYRRTTALVELSVRCLQNGEALTPEALVKRYEARFGPGYVGQDQGHGEVQAGARNQDAGACELRGIA